MNHNKNEKINDFDNSIEVLIEISKGSNIKYEFDKEKNCLVCDRILYTPFRYIFNYGFIPNTLSLDSDPIDAVVLMEDSLVPGCRIRCKIIGCLETTDSEGEDPKLIMCPINKIDPNSCRIDDINDLSSFTLEQIKYFFSHYKDLEKKNVQIGDFLPKINAIQIYNDSINRYNDTKLN